MIQEFIKDTKEVEAFITGSAGTGKTTKLYDIVNELIALKVPFKVVAYTHKAKDVLIKKLPVLHSEYITTLHAFLKKRPTVNSKATNIQKLLTSKQYGKPETLEILIIDEFSFVGEKDYMSLGDLQDTYTMAYAVAGTCTKCGSDEIDVLSVEDFTYNYECSNCKSKWSVLGSKPLKILYVGDTNQLNPVKDVQAIVPHEPYWTKLTKVYRQGKDNDLHITLDKLVAMIEERADVEYLEPTEDFKRDVPIDELFKADTTESKIILAFTNKAVQAHNSTIQGRDFPISGDEVVIPTLKMTATIDSIVSVLDYGSSLTVPGQIGFITHTTKFNPIKTIEKFKAEGLVQYFKLDSGIVVPAIFGVYKNKIQRDILAEELTALNRQDKNSKYAFKLYKTMSDYVSIMDFNHCMTIHKSQGNEYDHVYIDYKDLVQNCVNFKDVIRLLYVAISRAKFKVFMS